LRFSLKLSRFLAFSLSRSPAALADGGTAAVVNRIFRFFSILIASILAFSSLFYQFISFKTVI
jgi:hypothetical protein